MHAIRQFEFGGPETLRYESVPDLTPRPDTVIINVQAAGVHSVDTSIRRGEAGGPMALPDLPMTPGREAAGEVIAVGNGVDSSWLGATVVAHLGLASGGYADQAEAKVESLHRIPEGVDPQAAIALIGSGRTALAIMDAADVQEEDVLLVPGASGGLGNQLMQLGLAVKARVIALAGGEAKVSRVRGFGAEVIDYAEPDWQHELDRLTADRPATLQLDGVGGDIAETLLKSVGTLGRVVLFGWSSGSPLAFSTMDVMKKGLTIISGIGPAVSTRPGYLRELEERALAAGAAEHVRPLVQGFPLERAGDAHRAIEDRTAIGKVVLVP